MYALKKLLSAALQKNDMAAAVRAGREERRALSVLTRFAYEKDTLVGQRAIRATGLISRELAKTDRAALREACRKLLWSLSDESGAIGWAAPELLGEIVAADPGGLADIVPLIASVYDVEEVVFRPGVLYALARIGMQAPELALKHADLMLRGLTEQDPLAKVFALQALAGVLPLLGQDERGRMRTAVQALLSDASEAWVYEGSDFVNKCVREEAQKFLKEISSPH